MKKSKIYFQRKILKKTIEKYEISISYCHSYNDYDGMIMTEMVLAKLQNKLRKLEKKL